MLSHRLIEITAGDYPHMLEDVKEFIDGLDTLNVFERTLYVAEIFELLDAHEDSVRFDKTLSTLKSEGISDAVLTLFMQYKKWMI
ncbi:hypothetical protein EVJ20_07435 [Exiguobacterium sp. SH0S1]|uniref:hypothetical protein n=1 Tax=Exiguobacterium sp. SH0S1 TaxID=2510949 RepID=UPI00104007D3|nr:hypothetical protein [Exiguobacterium sp. SH0S1]TCI77784.1 hypothetical protein EVJ20_07435 [Exiguobacterium sp. SH0S1]